MGERNALSTSLAYILISATIVLLICRPARGECALFHGALESQSQITGDGGTINGSAAFITGVNGNAIEFSGSGFAVFGGDEFQSDSGSISFWIRKTSPDAQGGILQIGNLGQPNSLGVFYINENDIVFEIRGQSGSLASFSQPGLFQSGSWNHLTVSWEEKSSGVEMFAFVNGFHSNFALLVDELNMSIPQLQIGFVGFYGLGQCAIDELRFFNWPLLDGEAYGEYVFSEQRFDRQPTALPVSTGPVRIVNGELEVEGQPFTVKGANYSPTPVGADPGQFPGHSVTEVFERDAPILRALGANTVRTYAPAPDNLLLDALYNGGVDPIYLIMGYYVPVSGIDYGDPGVVAFHQNQFVSMVNQFKNHPGILAWGIGNEVNLGKTPQQLADWYAMAEALAAAAHAEEGASYHPTIIVNGSLNGMGDTAVNSDDASLGSVDLWGVNLYFGQHPRCHFDYYDALSAKPLIVTEFGIDALDDRVLLEYPTTQADYVVRQWRWIEQAGLGGIVFEYSDEWWKGGTPAIHDFNGYGTRAHPDGYSNEEWWGLLSAADNGPNPDVLTPRPAYTDLAVEFAHNPGDYDQDGDADLADFAAFQICAGGAADGPCGSAFDFAVDDVISVDDLSGVIDSVTGPG